MAEPSEDPINIDETEHCLFVAALPCNDLITHINLPLSKGEDGLLGVKTIPSHPILVNAICKFMQLTLLFDQPLFPRYLSPKTSRFKIST